MQVTLARVRALVLRASQLAAGPGSGGSPGAGRGGPAARPVRQPGSLSSLLQHGFEQLLLAAKAVVDHPLRGLGAAASACSPAARHLVTAPGGLQMMPGGLDTAR